MNSDVVEDFFFPFFLNKEYFPPITVGKFPATLALVFM